MECGWSVANWSLVHADKIMALQKREIVAGNIDARCKG